MEKASLAKKPSTSRKGRDSGKRSAKAVMDSTRAGMGCGSCKGLVAQLLEACLGEVGYDPSEHYYVPGVPLEKSQLVSEIKKAAREEGMRFLRESAVEQVLSGRTTLREINKVTFVE